MADGRKTGGRQKGTPNKATAAVRDVFSAFVEANSEKVQALFERVAESDPAKALDLLARLAEFVIPKLARTDLTGNADKNTTVIRVVGIWPLLPSLRLAPLIYPATQRAFCCSTTAAVP
jgi:hypothetical protein